MILEELFVALIVGISFSNAMVCVLLGFSTSSGEQKKTGLYFIAGRFLGLIILGLIIALIGVIFIGYIFHLLITFSILTILFGAFIIVKMYYRYKSHKLDADDITDQHTVQQHKIGPGMCHSNHKKHHCKHGHQGPRKHSTQGSKATQRYGFFLGLFRGATPCLKILILAPLLIIVDLPLAFLMIIVYASASTIYPLIGFLSANLLKNFSKYDNYVQVTGAIILISIGIFMIFNQLLTQNCSIGI